MRRRQGIEYSAQLCSPAMRANDMRHVTILEYSLVAKVQLCSNQVRSVAYCIASPGAAFVRTGFVQCPALRSCCQINAALLLVHVNIKLTHA